MFNKRRNFSYLDVIQIPVKNNDVPFSNFGPQVIGDWRGSRQKILPIIILEQFLILPRVKGGEEHVISLIQGILHPGPTLGLHRNLGYDLLTDSWERTFTTEH